MGFQFYIYKYRLNIAHSFNMENIEEGKHYHSLEITMQISLVGHEFTSYEEVERRLTRFYQQYASKFINEISPFDHIMPTIEHIGYEFYAELKERLMKHGYHLQSLEISETPSRSYVVNDYLITGQLSEFASEQEKKFASYLEHKIDSMDLDTIELKRIEYEKQQQQKQQQQKLQKEERIEKEKKQQAIIDCPPAYLGMKRSVYIPFVCILGLMFGMIAVYVIQYFKAYPSGSDVYLYLGKAEYLFSQLSKGHFTPIYMEHWYNGYQMFISSEPVYYYIQALLQLITGDSIYGYLLFVLLIFSVSFIGWAVLGYRMRHPLAGILLGICWLLLPINADYFWSVGNLPYMVMLCYVPFLFIIIYNYMHKNQKRYLILFTLISLLMFLTDSYAAIIYSVGIGIFLFGYSIYSKKGRSCIHLAQCIILSFIVIFPWFYSAIQNGLFHQLPVQSANGLGLSIIAFTIVAVFLTSSRKNYLYITLFVNILFVIGSKLEIMNNVSITRFLFHSEYSAFAYAVFFLVILQWHNIRKGVLLTGFFVFLITLLPYQWQQLTKEQGYEYYSELAANEGLDQAIKSAINQIMICDLDSNKSFPAYYITKSGLGVNYNYALEKQNPSTKKNIQQITYALYQKYYNYFFDRCKEGGNDTIVIKYEPLRLAQQDTTDLILAAQRHGYNNFQTTNDYYIFKMNTPKEYGFETNYEGLAIGDQSGNVSILYPYFEETTDSNIEHYSFDRLKKYKKLYLSGFTYDHKKKAEDLLLKLSKNGVQIYIDMNHIPVDAATNQLSFLGVNAQSVHFKTKFTSLIYKNSIKYSDIFYNEYTDWSTVYLDKLDQITGYSWVGDKKLCFSGTKDNSNLNFLGYNLIYHTVETRDEAVGEILDSIFGLKLGQAPNRTLTPCSIQYNGNEIQIDTPKPLVTTWAYQSTFESDQTISKSNQYLSVGEGKTTIRFSDSMQKKTIIYLFLLCAFLGITFIVTRNRSNKEDLLKRQIRLQRKDDLI